MKTHRIFFVIFAVAAAAVFVVTQWDKIADRSGRDPSETSASSIGGAVFEASGDLLSFKREPLVGVYYFGDFYAGTAQWRLQKARQVYDPQGRRDRPWFAGVEDFYNQIGGPYLIWKRRTPLATFDHLKPAIGYYDQADVRTIESHIDQAHLGGIDFFNFYWYWSAGKKSEALAASLHNFLMAKNNQKIKFMITVFSHSWDEDLKISGNDGALLGQIFHKYFTHPSYLTIKGRPVFAVGDWRGVRNGSVEALQDFIAYVKNYEVNNGSAEPYVLTHPGPDNWSSVLNNDGYACLAPDSSASMSRGPADYKKYIEMLPEFFAHFDGLAKPLAPCMISNFDERPRQTLMIDDPEAIRYFLNHNINEFYRGLELVRDRVAASDDPVSQLVNLYSWNEWHEGGIIEPNVKDGFLYLNYIEKAFKTVPLVRYQNGRTHRVTTELLAEGWRAEGTWLLYTHSRDGQNRVPLFECQVLGSENDYFLSVDPGCEAQGKIGLLGYMASKESASKAGLYPLYRCNYLGHHHFASIDSACEADGKSTAVNEGLLGYVLKK